MTRFQRKTIAVNQKGSRITAAVPYNLNEVCKSIPAYHWHPAWRLWTWPATPNSARQVLEGLRGTGVDVHVDKIVLDLAKLGADKAHLPAADHIDLEVVDEIYNTKTQPWSHQVRGVGMIQQLPATMLAWDMGTGKSKPVVDAVVSLDIKTAIVLCPKAIIPVWSREFAKHAGHEVKVIPPPKRSWSVAKRLEKIEAFYNYHRKNNAPVVIVLNYEAAWRDPLGSWLLKKKWGIIVCDESPRIKAPGGKASRFCQRLGPRAERRVCLTGTPMPHSPLDVYGQYRFLDPTIFGTSFARFRSMYAVMGGYVPPGQVKPVQIIGYQNQADLNQKFYSIADRVTKDDVLDLPDVIHETMEFDLGREGERIYRQLERDLIADVGSGVVVASNALSRLLRLQQITSGYAVTSEGQQEPIDSAKADVLDEVFEDIGADEPIVVFCRFHHDLDTIRNSSLKAGRAVFELSGRVNELEPWQDRDLDLCGDVLAVQIQAGGLGVDLTRSRYCVYFSVGFSLGDYEQSLARLHRPGQNHKVTYIHLVAENTVDQQVYDALQTKAHIIKTVLEWAKKGGK